MKVSSVRHLTYEGLKNVWDNRLMSLASVGVLICCMSLIGAAMLVTFNIEKKMASLEKENVIMAYLNDYNSVRYDDKYITADSFENEDTASAEDSASQEENSSETADDTSSETEAPSDVPYDDYLIHNEEEAMAVCDEIKRLDNIYKAEYISAEEGIVSFMEDHPEHTKALEQLKENDENPLSAAIRITLEDVSKYDESLNQIKQIDGVHSTESHRELAQQIASLKKAINMASYIIIGVLMLIALVIVCNTIRVTMFNRKLEISIMKAVGATDAFIRLPFVVEGIVIGVISAATTLGLLYLGYSAVLRAMAMSNPVKFMDHIALFIGIFSAVGIISGLIGSVFMINRYLKKEGSEFSALS